MRAIVVFLGISLVSLSAATLEYLSLEDMAHKSTAIVRGRIQSCAGQFRGSVIYTHCSVAVTEQWKGSSGTSVDVAVPGGSARGMIQSFPGSPTLAIGQEYVLFLWTGKSGMTQLIGLSQGVFNLKVDSKGQTAAGRAAATERMLTAAGTEMQDSPVQMTVRSLKQRILQALAGGVTSNQ